LEVHNCTNQAMISPALCTAHGPGKKYIAAVTASNNDVVKEMPVFRSGMHPSCCELVTIYLKLRKTIVQRVTVVKLGVYSGGDNCFFCGVKVKVETDTAESTNVMIAGFRQCRYLIRNGKMFVKYEAKVASRLSSVY